MADVVLGLIAGVIGAAAIAGIATYLNSRNNGDDDDDDNNYGYTPEYEEPREDNNRNNRRRTNWRGVPDDNEWDESFEDSDRDFENDINHVQNTFNAQNNYGGLKYIYIDFTKNLTVGSKNKRDAYSESIEEQFEKIKRKLNIYGINSISDLNTFIRYAFPTIESEYYISLPGFNRRLERITNNYGQVTEFLNNMVIRPEKSEIINTIIPNGLDLILVGDLQFRNNIITYVVKGIDLIDENVEKFGELKVKCVVACAITRDGNNRPDFGMNGRELYKSYLTRDSVLSLCENVYPIENPQTAIAVFEKWKRYIDFRKYYLEVQSQRNEPVDNVEYIKAYSISRAEYRKNEELYSEYVLDGFHNAFIKKDTVLLSEKVENSIEFPLIKVEVSKNLSVIQKELSRNKRTSKYEAELRSLTRNSVALSMTEPTDYEDKKLNLEYLSDRVSFVTDDIEPDYSDINEFFDKKLANKFNSVDAKYRNIVKKAIDGFRILKQGEMETQIVSEISSFASTLNSQIESDIQKNSDKKISKRYKDEIESIKNQTSALKKKLDKKYKNKKDSESIKKYNKDLSEILVQEKEKTEAIPLSEWYEERNEKLLKNYESSLKIQKSNELEKLCSQKEDELNAILSSEIENEKHTQKSHIDKARKEQIRIKKEKLTERHFYIYFKAEDFSETIANKKWRFLVYDNCADKAKIERQERSLYSFYNGYVKNPFLSSYLFSPETLGKSENISYNIEWFGNRLNDTQKEAVRKALASNSIFLLQGPPGTGKTEVISEIAAQYVKQGKKVLISSETHKAIDNVFERLPKIPEIRPLRLIPSNSNKETEYSPEKLVDNLYLGIKSKLQLRIKRYENFAQMKDNFSENMQALRFRYDQLLKLDAKCRQIQTKKDILDRELTELDSNIESKRAKMRPLNEEKESYSELISCIDRCTFSADLENEKFNNIKTYVYRLVDAQSICNDLTYDMISIVYHLDTEKAKKELSQIDNENAGVQTEQQKAIIRKKMNTLKDEFDEVIEGKEDEYKALQKELKALVNAKRESAAFDFSALEISKVVSADMISSHEDRELLINKIMKLQNNISDYLKFQRKEINDLFINIEKQINSIDNEISDIKIRKNNILAEKELLQEDESYNDYIRKKNELRKLIVEFFADFEIYKEYPADDFGIAIDIINNKWADIERNRAILEKENKAKIPMYKSIYKYLEDEEILEEDRKAYTKKLFDNANVFGMTCTSRNYYSESSMEALREYHLGNIDIKSVGIDVVIIDEVSKSSFLDLLIPILYGKTVILVGDHRQLPPMYDLKHLRKDDFECLDPEVIDFCLNKEYQKLYETCYFKELFESVPDAYKIMLNKQYRCHSDIMDVFNHFYNTNGSGLTVGLSNQNDFKQHGLLIKTKKMTIIEPQKHIYFVNCNKYESKKDVDSSSIINDQEADVVCRLLEMIDEQYGKMIKSGEISSERKKDERKSVGVICTYGDQAGEIKKRTRKRRFNNISGKREERLVISTVDDFQGDERDIIIVSMVRNPKGTRYSTDFIDKFERINVALSRARCMLIVVGSQDFLSKSSINLPDINGRKEFDKNAFPVYREIIRTIQIKGRVLQAADIIGEEQNDER